jgi:hypothetical protein
MTGPPLCLIGDSGTSESHLPIEPGHRGSHGRFPVKAADGKQPAKMIARYGRVDLLYRQPA